MANESGNIGSSDGSVETVETIVVGGSQTGLTVGYHLAKAGRPFLILDAHERVGDAWRERWDSLRLFTPARFDGLPGMRFPARGSAFITKDEMADFLEAYARHFELEVRTGERVERLTRRADGRFDVSTSRGRYEADNVVVAMANFQQPHVPPFASQLDPNIVQLHSRDYKNPSQLQDGPVLVVGAGNSGAEIAYEVARTHDTWLAGRESGHIPFPIESFLGRNVLVRVVRFLGYHVLTLATPIGRKVRPKFTHAAPLVRVRPRELAEAGVERVGRVEGVTGGRPTLDDRRTLDVANVIWCTGYRPGFSWIDLPILGDRQEPFHHRGIVDSVPGLYFVGLHFQFAATSATITGMPRDARRVVKQVVARGRSRRPRVRGASRSARRPTHTGSNDRRAAVRG